VNPLEFLDHERALYAAEWSEHNAAGFEAGGHYAWMADHVAGHQSVLEVGTGDGRSTAALLARGHSVISVDENVGCLMLASDRLSAAGFGITLHERELERQTNGREYAIRYANAGPVAHPPASTVALVEGNVLNDWASMRSPVGSSAFIGQSIWTLRSIVARRTRLPTDCASKTGFTN
jgi:hypothetical protein